MRFEPSERIDLRIMPVWKISGLVRAVLLGAVGYALAAILVKSFDWAPWLAWLPLAAAVVYGGLEVTVLPRLRWERWRYQVSGEEVYLQRGIWFVKRTLIPITRIQHVDTAQGILMRRYGLAAVEISTAAGTHEIPALAEEAADALRDRIAALARVSDDVI